ncbi:hypothetical protein [Thermococcus sp. 21S9]|uniref:hypothetical protein n=1 Tax=Thermococcus sp. 21S9 TaxID=1638223 RepID=UPI00143A5FF6|nr:hypothetical protein [Thermococcus sp. 21S9]NJE54746.1 hypothetical protein [Thermococcus sp. 21S9]
MDELEFCVKSLSYPLGTLLETLKRKPGERVEIDGVHLTLPELPFAVKCYLTARALFESLDLVDRKRLGDDMAYVEEFIARVLSSPLGEKIRPYLEKAGEISTRGRLNVDWLEFERRSEKLRPLLKRILAGEEPPEVSNLSVDECLLLSYLAGERKKRERVNAVLGKLNPAFREAVKAYFRALKS